MSVAADIPDGMRWSDISAQQPTLGQIAQETLIKPGVLLVGTIRRDGVARISRVEPLIMNGQLWLSMMRTSAKALDLDRDPRIVLNSIVIGPEPAAEVKIRGTAHAESNRAVQQRYATAVAAEIGWQPVLGQFTLFRIDIDDVTYIGYDPDTHGQHVAQWPPCTEYLRPATTPTSLGPRQPADRLLH
jgi:hypothetical protein